MVVTDNNSINRKAMRMFNNPLAEYVYPHPCDPQRPLFYCIDSVHIIKCVRNNWLNQKNCGQAMLYPDFDQTNCNNVHDDNSCSNSSISESSVIPSPNDSFNVASLSTIRKMYEAECGNMLKFGYTLSQKALWPTSLERQNVKLALDIFNSHIAKSLTELSEKHNLMNAESTSNYISIFRKWFDIMNVKTPCKGFHLRNNFQEPLTCSESDEKLLFLHKFVNWLDLWKSSLSESGKLTREKYSALLITTNAMIDFTEYCIKELGMSYILPGKIQTDDLEFRFGLYRRLAGSQYHISIRQIYEIETKIRNFSVMKLSLQSGSKGSFVIDSFFDEGSEESLHSLSYYVPDDFVNIQVDDSDISNVDSDMPLLTYLAGYCAHSLLKRKKCKNCECNLTIEKELNEHPNFRLIHSNDRGGLRFPSLDVVNTIVHNFIIVKKIISCKELESKFLLVSNQLDLIINVTMSVLNQKEMSIDYCEKHRSEEIQLTLIRTCSNTLLKNYCKEKNSKIVKVSNKRKLQTLTK